VLEAGKGKGLPGSELRAMLALKSPSSRFGHSFACLTRPCLCFALALDARWFIVPAAPRFRKHPILLNFTRKAFDGSLKGLAISDHNLCHSRCGQPSMRFVVSISRLTSFLGVINSLCARCQFRPGCRLPRQ
jgi:hypothetical protein